MLIINYNMIWRSGLPKILLSVLIRTMESLRKRGLNDSTP